MKIGIIGSGLAGLAAGRELARAGHEITVIEKNRGLGGRLATLNGGNDGNIPLDYGIPWFAARSPEFRGFVSELLDKELVGIWGDGFWNYDGEHLLTRNPNVSDEIKYIAPEGMNRIAAYLSRWLDVHAEEKAGGLTYLGANRGRKRPWMINLTTFNTFEADAVIIAAPAPEAYSILLTTQDEVNVLRMIREIDEIRYEPSYALMATYGPVDQPEWNAVSCQDPVLRFVSNENSKRSGLAETSLVAWSSPGFTREQIRRGRVADPRQISGEMLEALSRIAGRWAGRPQWSRLHEWRFARPVNVIDRPFMEFESEDAPLALVGDYFTGGDVDHSYASGVRLARHWIKKFSENREAAAV